MSEFLCRTCAGCCKDNTGMALTRSDVKFMKAGGTALDTVLPAVDDICWAGLGEIVVDGDEDGDIAKRMNKFTDGMKEGEGFYVLRGDCGYLEEVDGLYQCNAYEDPNRPRICQDFTAGSVGCLALRIAHGVEKIA